MSTDIAKDPSGEGDSSAAEVAAAPAAATGGAALPDFDPDATVLDTGSGMETTEIPRDVAENWPGFRTTEIPEGAELELPDEAYAVTAEAPGTPAAESDSHGSSWEERGGGVVLGGVSALALKAAVGLFAAGSILGGGAALAVTAFTGYYAYKAIFGGIRETDLPKFMRS